jgi:hypothetical protein
LGREPAPWIELKRASASDDPYLHGLDNGEREAILLAEELSADLRSSTKEKAGQKLLGGTSLRLELSVFWQKPLNAD